MAVAKTGDEVSVHYTGTLDDGEIFDSSEGRAPLSFTLGRGQVIPGFDSAVQGMTIGDRRKVRIAAEDAYGPRDEGLVHEVERKALPADLALEVGQMLRVRAPGGQPARLTVVDITDEHVTLDGNHELAGEALTFEIHLVAIA